MNINDFKGKRITVMGLGLHGGAVETARFLCEAGAKVTVTDIKSKEELAPSIEKLKGLKNISFVFNQHRPEDFIKADMVVKNPAASWNNKYIQMALEKKVPVEIDSSLFFKLCHNPIIGVTGTKGKTTVATLIYEILKKADKNVIKVGIGQVSVLDKLKDLKKDAWVVFELSSWRLSALGRNQMSPRVAVITNIYPDHLNYYKTMEEYVEDKKFIYSGQKNSDFCILNWDDEILNKLESEVKSQLIKFSLHKTFSGRSAYILDDVIYLNDGIDEKKIIEVSKVKLKGTHNLNNVLAAVAAAYALGVNLETIRKTIMEFEGIKHRLELIRELNGVKYYNDTSATTPESAIAGINSFAEPIILICGGSDKNLNMADLGKVIAERAKGVVFLKGAGTDKIIQAVKNNLPPRQYIGSGGLSPEDKEREFKITESMEKAVELATLEASAGDAVLLSPGAASFGMFVDSFDRGNKFKEAVENLK